MPQMGSRRLLAAEDRVHSHGSPSRICRVGFSKCLAALSANHVPPILHIQASLLLTSESDRIGPFEIAVPIAPLSGIISHCLADHGPN